MPDLSVGVRPQPALGTAPEPELPPLPLLDELPLDEPLLLLDELPLDELLLDEPPLLLLLLDELALDEPPDEAPECPLLLGSSGNAGSQATSNSDEPSTRYQGVCLGQ